MSARASAYAKGLLVCPNGELISPREKLVLMVLADSHQDRAGRFTYPSVSTIAEDSMCDKRSCQRYMASLERKGAIRRMRPANQGRSQITYYFFAELDELPKGWQDAALSDAGIFLQKGGKRVVERAAKGRQNAPSLNRTRTREPEPKQEQEQKQLPLIPLASEGGVANRGEGDEALGKHTKTRQGNGGGNVPAANLPLGVVPENRTTGASSRLPLDSGMPLAATQEAGSDAASASSAADLAQVADARGSVERGTAFADVSDGRCGLGHDDDAVVANELRPDQLEHLEACHPAMRAEFERYYREENAKAAKVTHKADDAPAPALEFADTAAARAWVMRECGYVENRRRRGVGPVIEAALQERAAQGEALGGIAARMVEAVRKYTEAASRMRFQYGPAKFFELGLWCDENKWPWDYAGIRKQQAMAF